MNQVIRMMRNSCPTISSINLKPAILRIQGVGDMMIMGGDYSMRIWMKPDVMASKYRLIPSDVTPSVG